MCVNCRWFKKKQENRCSTPLEETPKNSVNVPFFAELPDLHVGKAICVSGVVLPKCSRFSVNLTCGRGPSADLGLHINPRILQKYIVRNSRLNGQWGNEETTSTVKFPFERNRNFLITIFVAKEEFLISVNGAHYCSFKFRTNLSKITAIDVQGLVDVLKIEQKVLEVYPEIGEKPRRVGVGEEEEGEMTGSVTFLLPGAFQRDWQLEIYGRVKILPHSFYINLQEGSHQWPHPAIPLHLNPRFGMGSGESVFVRNAWVESRWGQEERTPGFQFSPGSPFTMAIRRGNDHFSVWIDGKLAGEFKFRATIDKIDTVHIQGDVVVHKVGLNEKPGNLAPMQFTR